MPRLLRKTTAPRTVADVICFEYVEAAPTPITDSTVPKKSKRGYAKGIAEWGTGLKIDLMYNAKFQVVGEKAASFAGQLGLIVRSGRRVPITYLKWSTVSWDIKDSIWNEVKDNVNYVPDEFKEYCLNTCSRLWKRHKSYIKSTYYTPNKASVQILTQVPPEVLPEHWRDMVFYWRSEAAQGVANKNARNRANRGPTHRTGRTHFSQIRHMIEQKGQKVNKMELWMRTRDLTDPEVMLIMERYQNELSKLPEIDQTIEASDQIFHKIFGEDGHGYCKTYGSGVSKRAVYPRDATGGSQPLNGCGMSEEDKDSLTNHILAQVRKEFDEKLNALKLFIVDTLQDLVAVGEKD